YAVTTNTDFVSFGFLADAAAVFAAAFVLGFVAKLVALQVTRWQFAAGCRRCAKDFSKFSAPDAGISARQQAGG
ncbi:MAG: hypothetical protein ACREJC_04185, partial [Tepidisphaeraceae bacterium]